MERKIVMITGSGMGIGLACAEAFAREGATVIMSDIQKPDEQAQKLVDAGYDAVAYQCDVSDVQAVSPSTSESAAAAAIFRFIIC